jgi:hypothetical protein
MARVRMMRALADALGGVSPKAARYFAPGLSVPASEIFSIGLNQSIAPGTSIDGTFQISRPGVVVGLLLSDRGLGALTLDEEAANLEWQLTRENTITTAANISTLPGAGGPGFASARGMTSQWPWLPLVVPARGAGTWTLTVRNIHPGEPISVVANLAFLGGVDAFHRGCAELTIVPEMVEGPEAG